MILMSEREQVRTVAARWKRQYPNDNKGTRFADIHAALVALGPETATADDVARIIGNRSWVGPETCYECGSVTWDCVQIGEDSDSDFESRTALVCGACLRRALALLGAADPGAS